jgi:predicted nucleic acid-binding protein
VARIIVLDSGPLGLLCARRNRPEFDEITFWSIQAVTSGSLIAIPEIADYEVRRGLIKAGSKQGIGRLDALHGNVGFHFVPISTRAMLRAAEVWALVRNRGLPTADEGALDGDAILAAQALEFCGARDELIVATENASHMSRFGLDARSWRAITP